MLGLKTRKDIKRLFNQNISHKQWKHDCVLGHSMSTNTLKDYPQIPLQISILNDDIIDRQSSINKILWYLI